jgi:hypothetical protein
MPQYGTFFTENETYFTGTFNPSLWPMRKYNLYLALEIYLSTKTIICILDYTWFPKFIPNEIVFMGKNVGSNLCKADVSDNHKQRLV